MMECKIIKEEIKWLKARETVGIKYSRGCKEGFANGVIWYADGHLSPIPPPLPPNYMKDLDRQNLNVQRQRPKCMQR